MRILGSKKVTAEADNRIALGSIVEYEQHGVPLLGAVVAEKRDKFVILNARSAQLELPAARLYLLPGKLPETATDPAQKARFLEELQAEADKLVSALQLEELWGVFSEESRELTIVEAAELAFGNNELLSHLAARRALLGDRIYFKRQKTGFEARPAETVQSLKLQVEAELAQARKRDELIDAVVKRIADGVTPLPKSVELLENYAAFGKSFDGAKDAMAMVDEIATRARVSLQKKGGDRAFEILVAAKYFNPDQNLTLIRLGRASGFSDAVIKEAQEVAARPASSFSGPHREEATGLFTLTIDSESTLDRDDALSIEHIEGGYRIGIHIADVDAMIAPGSALEDEAFGRATSIYCPDAHIPMLPSELSEQAASLLEDVDRPVMSLYVEVDENFKPLRRRITHSMIRVKKCLSYEAVDKLLYEPGDGILVKEMLLLLWDATCVFEARRLQAGAMQFNRREMTVKIHPDNTLTLEEANEDTPAHKLVSEMMILANETAALFGSEHSLPLVYRSQEAPDVNLDEQGLEIPEGPARDYYQRSFLKRSVTGTMPGSHYGLGLPAYIQATSPIRRAADLLNQRQISQFLRTGKIFYSEETLAEILASLESGLDEAFQIQRERSRYYLLRYLVQENIRELDALIIKTDGPKPLAELDQLFMMSPFHPASDMKDTESARKRRGERIRLRIDSIDPRADSLVLREVR
ncbi:MAG: RNB domain-containing ribonuclease [Bdellovibrionota bacterium]